MFSKQGSRSHETPDWENGEFRFGNALVRAGSWAKAGVPKSVKVDDLRPHASIYGTIVSELLGPRWDAASDHSIPLPCTILGATGGARTPSAPAESYRRRRMKTASLS